MKKNLEPAFPFSLSSSCFERRIKVSIFTDTMDTPDTCLNLIFDHEPMYLITSPCVWWWIYVSTKSDLTQRKSSRVNSLALPKLHEQHHHFPAFMWNALGHTWKQESHPNTCSGKSGWKRYSRNLKTRGTFHFLSKSSVYTTVWRLNLKFDRNFHFFLFKEICVLIQIFLWAFLIKYLAYFAWKEVFRSSVKAIPFVNCK